MNLPNQRPPFMPNIPVQAMPLLEDILSGATGGMPLASPEQLLQQALQFENLQRGGMMGQMPFQGVTPPPPPPQQTFDPAAVGAAPPLDIPASPGSMNRNAIDFGATGNLPPTKKRGRGNRIQPRSPSYSPEDVGAADPSGMLDNSGSDQYGATSNLGSNPWMPQSMDITYEEFMSMDPAMQEGVYQQLPPEKKKEFEERAARESTGWYNSEGDPDKIFQEGYDAAKNDPYRNQVLRSNIEQSQKNLEVQQRRVDDVKRGNDHLQERLDALNSGAPVNPHTGRVHRGLSPELQGRVDQMKAEGTWEKRGQRRNRLMGDMVNRPGWGQSPQKVLGNVGGVTYSEMLGAGRKVIRQAQVTDSKGETHTFDPRYAHWDPSFEAVVGGEDPNMSEIWASPSPSDTNPLMEGQQPGEQPYQGGPIPGGGMIFPEEDQMIPQMQRQPYRSVTPPNQNFPEGGQGSSDQELMEMFGMPTMRIAGVTNPDNPRAPQGELLNKLRAYRQQMG